MLTDRRQLLRIGSLSAIGLGLPQLLLSEAQASVVAAKAKSCILYFMEGGPSHIDLWDMKPNAPAEVRGTYKPIATRIPGFQVCEHLPQWTSIVDRLAIVRSVTHSVVDHNAGTYQALTGKHPFRAGRLVVGPSPDNAPPIGSVVAKLRPSDKAVPDFVHLPEIMFNNGNFIPGQRAGLLGSSFDPYVAGDPSRTNYHAPGMTRQISSPRMIARRKLLNRLSQQPELAESKSVERLAKFSEKAHQLVSLPHAQRAFDLRRESAQLRRRYGIGYKRGVPARQGGGLPSLGQSLLLARRLIETGVRLVTVTSGLKFDQSFDTHRNHYPLLTKSLLPYLNQSFSALIEDMDDRGLLDETLVVALTEFGRTPRLGQITSNAGADRAGRDHWPHCYSVFFAGAGVKRGVVYGSSDRHAGYPRSNPVSPADVAATIYHLLGIDPSIRFPDRLGRPHTVVDGQPITAILT